MHTSNYIDLILLLVYSMQHQHFPDSLREVNNSTYYFVNATLNLNFTTAMCFTYSLAHFLCKGKVDRRNE